MRVWRTGLIGFGNVAEHGHLPAWRERADFNIVAVAEPDAERRTRAKELLPGAAVYETAAELLSCDRVHVLDISTPPRWHAPLTAAAANAGCHVLCEKPIATSAAEYRDTSSAVRRAGVTLCPVHNWKHSAQFQRVAGLVAEGTIGRLRKVEFETIRKGRAVTVGRDWRADAELGGGGILIDHGWHALYMLLDLARERPRQIRARIERRRSDSADVEDTASCWIDFASLTGEIHLTWAGTERHTRWLLHGSEGSLLVEENRLEVCRDGKMSEFEFERSLSAGSHHPDWFRGVIDGFAGELRAGTSTRDSLEEAELCLLLTNLAYESGARGGRALAVPARSPYGSSGM